MLVDYTNIVAFNDAGFAWRTDRLSWDGVTIEMITENEIHGRGWSAPEHDWVDFTVNLVTGEHTGGAAPGED